MAEEAKSGLTEDMMAQLALKLPGVRLYHLKHGGHEAVFRSPGRSIWKLYLAQQRDDSTKIQANDVLIANCRIWPESAALEAIFEDAPGLVETWALKLMEAAGFSAGGGEAKKL
jgi:hypothetical protein